MEIWIKETWLSYFIPMGWALFHSLWQSLIIFFLYKLVLASLPKISSQFRYAFGLLILLTLFLGFMAEIFIQYQDFKPTSLPSSFKSLSHLQNNLSFSLEKIQSEKVSPLELIESLPIRIGISLWGLFYTLLLALMMGKLIRNIFQIQNLKASGKVYPPGEDLNALFEKLKTKLAFPSHAKLWLSTRINSPMTFGFIKPIILFPLSVCSKLTISQLEGLLIHEMAHILRKDYLMNILQSIAETFLFFNPLMSVLNRDIRLEREKCCDDWVSEYYSGESIEYAKTLLSLEENRVFQLSLPAKANQNQLLTRIKRIMKNQKESIKNNHGFLPVLFLFLGMATIGLLSSGKIMHKDLPSLWKQNDTNPPSSKKSNLNDHPYTAEEHKKILEILGLEMGEKNLEMDTMQKMMALKNQEMKSLGDLIRMKGKELQELQIHMHDHSLSTDNIAPLLKLKIKQQDSIQKLIEFKAKEMENMGLLIQSKGKEMDSLGRMISKKSLSGDSLSLILSFNKDLAPTIPEAPLNRRTKRKLSKIQKEIKDVELNKLNIVINDAVKNNLDAKIFIQSPEIQIQMDKAQDDALKALEILKNLDLKKQIEASIQANKLNWDNNSLDQIQKETEKAAKYGEEAEKISQSPEYKEQIRNAIQQLKKAEKEMNSPEFKREMKKAQEEIEKAKQELNPLNIHSNINLHLDLKPQFNFDKKDFKKTKPLSLKTDTLNQ